LNVSGLCPYQTISAGAVRSDLALSKDLIGFAQGHGQRFGLPMSIGKALGVIYY